MKKRNIKITAKMTADAKKMLELLGCPVVEALCEAESQCVALVKEKKADAVASEDMDCLTFGAPLLLRGFTQRRDKKDPICEIELVDVLTQLDLTMDQFIDFCILCGCDYAKTIERMGPTTAYKMIQEHKNIEKILEVIQERNAQRQKEGKDNEFGVPDAGRFDFVAARNEFKACKAFPGEPMSLDFKEPDEAALKAFLVEEKAFSEARVNSALEKLKLAKKKGIQTNLESFFGKPMKILAQPSPGAKTMKSKAKK